MEQKNDLGLTLRKLRGDRALRDIAKITGISHTYLSLLEKGIDPRTKKEIKPSVEILRILASVYNYPYEKLLEAAKYLPAENLDRLSPEYIKTCEELKDLSEQDLKAIQVIAERLKRKSIDQQSAAGE